MRELIDKKERKEMVMRYLVNNPNESLRSVGDRFGVSKDTVMRLKGKVPVSNETKNSPKRGNSVSFETLKPTAPATVSAAKIEKQMLFLVEKITEMEQVTNQLAELHSFQIVDGLAEQGSSILPSLPIWAEILEKAVRVYRGVLDERNYY